MQFVWIVRLRFRLFGYAVVAEDRYVMTVKPRDHARKTGNEQEGKENIFCHVLLSGTVQVRTTSNWNPQLWQVNCGCWKTYGQSGEQRLLQQDPSYKRIKQNAPVQFGMFVNDQRQNQNRER